MESGPLAAQKRNSFGSCQEKRIFPLFHAPDRLGNQFVPVRGDPILGPGSYDPTARNNLLYHLLHRPESVKGYSMGARTTERFTLFDKFATPAPTSYQSIWIRDRKRQPVYIPFYNKSPRFPQKIPDSEAFPGPGTYDPGKIPHRHVTWPGKFGSPDWSLIPAQERRALKTELITDKEFKKHRNLVAYLSIYYRE